MLTPAQIESFQKNGYLLVPGVLTAQEVAFMRKRVLDIFDSGEWKRSPYNTENVLTDIYNYFPEFIDLTLNTKTLGIIKDLLGEDPVLMPETAVHYQLYTDWHKDTTSLEKEGHTFHLEPGALMIEAGFYLQDNNEWGGGLTVMPGSHKTGDVFKGEPLYINLFKRVVNKFRRPDEKNNRLINAYRHDIIDIPSKAGDLVIFNFKTNHRATRPNKQAVEEIPAENKKIAFFNAFSANNKFAQAYLNYLCTRPEPFYQSLKNRKHTYTELTKNAKAYGYQNF